jgi:predicted aspartyl protease
LQNGDRKISVNVTFDTGSYYTYFQKNIISDLGLQKSNQVIEITGLGSTLQHSVFSGNLSSNENRFPGFVLQSSPALEKHLKKSSLSGMLGLEVLKAWGVIVDFSTNKFIIPRLAKEARETHNNSLQNLSNMKAEELIHADPSSSLNTHSIKSEGMSLRNADDSRLLVRNTTEELEITDRVYNINYSPSSYDPYIQIQTRGETEKIQLSLLIDTGACFGNLTEAIIQRLALKQIPIRRETSLLHESGRAEQYYKAFLGISQNSSYFGDLGAKNSQHFKEIGLDGLIGVHILKGQMGAILNFQNDTLTVTSDKPMPAFLDEEMQPSCQQRYIYGTRYTVCCDINRCWVQD